MQENALSNVFVISANDPAINKSKSQIDEYVKTYDRKHLVFNDGSKPVVFELQPIPIEYQFSVLESPTFHPQFKAYQAFKIACVKVMLPNGDVLTPKETYEYDKEVRFARDDWAASIRSRLGAKTIVEIGNVAITKAMLPDGEFAPFLRD